MSSRTLVFLFSSFPIRELALFFVTASVLGCGRPPALYDPGSTRARASASLAPSVSAIGPLASPTYSMEPTATATPSARATDFAAATPTFSVTDISSPDESGDTNIPLSVAAARFGTLSVLTAGNASCIAGGMFPSGARMSSPGLGPKVADATGAVNWSFSASTSERGRASYTLTCSRGASKRTLMVSFTI
jgi:hypothetical protein